MIIRLALVESEPFIFEACDRHSGPVCSLDPHSGIFYDKALIPHGFPEYPLYSGRSPDSVCSV